jgi:hypothetical protein
MVDRVRCAISRMKPAISIIIFPLLVSLSACSQAQPTPDPDTMPKSPLSLPLVSAELNFSGRIEARLTSVRLLDCKAHPAGSVDFFRSTVLFQIGPQWYRLTVLTSGPLRLDAGQNSSSYKGAGDYRGWVDLTEQLVGPGGMALGDHAWSTRGAAAITVTVPPKAVRLGTVVDPTPPAMVPVTIKDGVDLEPRDMGTTGPGPTPGPATELVHLHGQWSCE